MTHGATGVHSLDAASSRPTWPLGWVRAPLLSGVRQLRYNGVVFIGTDEQRTRERVLAAVSEHGPVTAAEVGRLLGLTPAAVRRHLDALADQGAVAEHEPAGAHTPGHVRGRGRPARAYVL